MNCREIDWGRLQDRTTRWWRGELDTPLIYLAVCPDPSANLTPRPHDHAGVKQWFMDPETRLRPARSTPSPCWFLRVVFRSVFLGAVNKMVLAC